MENINLADAEIKQTKILKALNTCERSRVFSGGEVQLFATAEQFDVMVRKMVQIHAKRLLDALDGMDLGCREPGFQGHENGLGDEEAGNELQAAREELAAFVIYSPEDNLQGPGAIR